MWRAKPKKWREQIRKPKKKRTTMGDVKGKEERVAVVCKRASHEFQCGRFLEGEVVHLSGEG